MALKPCRECKTEVSESARKCPQCGVDFPVNQPPSILGCVGAVLVFGLAVGVGSLFVCPASSTQVESEFRQ